MTDPIKLTRLPSGLTVVTERMERMETVSFGAYVAAGTRNETAEENGVSHFLEHMAFKGTSSRSALRIAEEIENVGGHINAYTAREQTVFYVKLLKENLSLGIDIIGDILTHSAFDPAELERERGVILQEIGQANDTPDDIVFDHFQETAFPHQPMGRPTLGTEGLFRDMSRETLMRYMATHYTPDNMIVAAAGNLEHDAVVDLVNRHFADLKNAPRPTMDPARMAGVGSVRSRNWTKPMFCWASPLRGMGTATILPRCCYPLCRVGACRPACSRKSGKNAVWSIPFIPSTCPSWMGVCLAFTQAQARRNVRN